VAVLDYDGSGDQDPNFTDFDGVTDDLVTVTNNFGFHVEVVGNSHPVTFRLEAYSTADDWSFRQINIPGLIPMGSHVDFFLFYNTFSTGGSGPADFTSIDALRIVVTSASPDSEFRLDFVEASTKRDFGDADVSYGEVSHAASLGTRLGQDFDTEANQFYSANATGDDLDTMEDDEDGVVRTPGWVWNTTQGGRVDVDVRHCPAACTLAGWVDFSKNGNFTDPGERIINIAATPGVNTYAFPITGVISGNYLARFRIFEQIVADPQPLTDGQGGGAGTYAIGGEVEDYFWAFSPTAIELTTLEAASGGLGAAEWALILTLAVCPVLLVGLYFLRRRDAR
jgi:hypothetical protein